MVTCMLTIFLLKEAESFEPENSKPLREETIWKTSRKKRVFRFVEAGFQLISQNRFQSLFQTTYKYIKVWERFSWYLHANTRTNRFFNASWKNRHSISFLQHFFQRNLFACGIHFTHVNTSQKFLSWNRKTSIKKHFPKKVILECAFELVQKLVWEHHQKNFGSESGKTLGIFLPKNFTEHLDVNFEKTCWWTSAST